MQVCARNRLWFGPTKLSEWVDTWRIDDLLTQNVYQNGCIRAAPAFPHTKVIMKTMPEGIPQALSAGAVAPYTSCSVNYPEASSKYAKTTQNARSLRGFLRFGVCLNALIGSCAGDQRSQTMQLFYSTPNGGECSSNFKRAFRAQLKRGFDLNTWISQEALSNKTGNPESQE